MTIESVSIYSYSITLNETAAVYGAPVNGRDGFVIEIIERGGNAGYGEISPLPGLDEASLDDCLQDLKRFAESAAHKDIMYETYDPESPCLGLLEGMHRHGPLALFGIESALMMLAMKSGKSPGASEMKKPGAGISVKVNGLFIPSSDEKTARSRTGYLVRSGFETVKVKIGRLDADTEIRQITEMHEALGPQVKLRLDGNRSMTREKVMEYHSRMKHLPVEYIEEPLPDGEFQGLPWPVAMDESLKKFSSKGYPDRTMPPSVRAAVIKPGALPGLHGIRRFMGLSGTQGITTTLSSSYNTGLGISFLGLMAAAIPSSLENAHGLDTYRYLDRDILAADLSMEKGIMYIPWSIFTGPSPINMDMLKRVTV